MYLDKLFALADITLSLLLRLTSSYRSCISRSIGAGCATNSLSQFSSSKF